MFNFFNKEKVEPIPCVIQQEENFSNIAIIAKYFHNETGIIFDKQLAILKNKLVAFCRQRNIYSFEDLLKDIKSDSTLKQELIDHLTTNETFFYRELKIGRASCRERVSSPV